MTGALEAIDLFHKGQERFERKQWDEALGLFEKALEVLPGDGPSELFAERCRAFKKKPPPGMRSSTCPSSKF